MCGNAIWGAILGAIIGSVFFGIGAVPGAIIGLILGIWLGSRGDESPTPAHNPPPPPSQPEPMYFSPADVVGRTCPYCRLPIKPSEQVSVCPQCRTPHHADCWTDNGNVCTTYGCTGCRG